MIRQLSKLLSAAQLFEAANRQELYCSLLILAADYCHVTNLRPSLTYELLAVR